MSPSAIVITGASRGIGRALAMELASRGHRIGLVARRREALDDLAAEIRDRGGIAHASAADVSDRRSLRASIEQLEGALGPVDVMVANAGFGAPTRLDPLNVADVEETFRVNVLGVVYAIEAVLPGMIARGRGQIVAISSLAAFKGLPGESAYCASKAAVNAYAEGLRIALRRKGVAVATVCPGFVATSITPMDAAATPFEMTPEAAARRIARVIERRASGVVSFPWPMAALMALIARLPDRLVARLVGHGPEPPAALTGPAPGPVASIPGEG
ncbi:SDR family NAD(P)-dependent oxidoreductase [Aquisphaera insulae]|uniref:SDR family NAD(P)-dependent oxidoreductase n=1 Tax=Aquisphaera insulae TaxID=2712864 RepID=UPI0013EC7A65|nr:SDR family NAD(P)-dependent oxidoreductase [Aquisphaera insulae]